jgi:CHAT domain-containing protein
LVPPANVASRGRGLLAVGGPLFDDVKLRSSQSSQAGRIRAGASLPCADLHSLQFQPLPETLREAQEVGELWTHSVSGEEPDDKTIKILKGSSASESLFKQLAPGRRVLHVATHGFFLNNQCTATVSRSQRSVGGLAGRNQSSELDAALAENPLLLSGLALAGANRHSTDGFQREDDGILTAEEVTTLDLKGVEWAVLSACDTGLGEVKSGEGVFGLRRAFQIAGVRTVIISLWSVDDSATRQWMSILYDRRLRSHLSTAEATHEATVRMLRGRRARKQTTNPFYWAAFVAAGDWR